jgi:hypothetical protein
MGHDADVCQPTSHGDLGSYGGGDSKVKMTRLATSALRRPPHGSKTQSSAISKKATCWLAAASRVASGAGSSRDGQRNCAKHNLED